MSPTLTTHVTHGNVKGVQTLRRICAEWKRLYTTRSPRKALQ